MMSLVRLEMIAIRDINEITTKHKLMKTLASAVVWRISFLGIEQSQHVTYNEYLVRKWQLILISF